MALRIGDELEYTGYMQSVNGAIPTRIVGRVTRIGRSMIVDGKIIVDYFVDGISVLHDRIIVDSNIFDDVNVDCVP